MVFKNSIVFQSAVAQWIKRGDPKEPLQGDYVKISSAGEYTLEIRQACICAVSSRASPSQAKETILSFEADKSKHLFVVVKENGDTGNLTAHIETDSGENADVKEFSKLEFDMMPNQLSNEISGFEKVLRKVCCWCAFDEEALPRHFENKVCCFFTDRSTYKFHLIHEQKPIAPEETGRDTGENIALKDDGGKETVMFFY